jgi:DNA-binding transcriptional regulator YhcF (GntR family)
MTTNIDTTIWSKTMCQAAASAARDQAADYERKAAELRAQAEALDPLFTDEAPPAGGAPAPKPRGVSAGKSPAISAAEVRELADDVLAELSELAGDVMSCRVLAESLARPTADVSRALAYLEKQGHVNSRGHKRGKVYFVEHEGPSTTDDALAEPEDNILEQMEKFQLDS